MQPIPSRVAEVLRALGDLSPAEGRAFLERVIAALDDAERDQLMRQLPGGEVPVTALAPRAQAIEVRGAVAEPPVGPAPEPFIDADFTVDPPPDEAARTVAAVSPPPPVSPAPAAEPSGPSDEELARALRAPRWKLWAGAGAIALGMVIGVTAVLWPHGEADTDVQPLRTRVVQPEPAAAPPAALPTAPPPAARPALKAPPPGRRVASSGAGAPAAEKPRAAEAAPARPERKKKVDPFESRE
ncbi:MAG: hypothetical protein IPJ65_19765 [Archangiaceae bacterium]|nr:hypothetical protein [Archangiaceae bacterium]